jgi:hypothetical protein
MNPAFATVGSYAMAKETKAIEGAGVIVSELKSGSRAASLESSAKVTKVVQLEKKVSEWLGEGAKFIRNEAGDSVFLSKDGLRCVRFDFNRTKPHNNLHAHVEIKVGGKWVKSGQIYPTDVPHN